MAARLSLAVFIVWAIAIATLTEAYPNEDLNEGDSLHRRGWFWGSKKKSEPKATDTRRPFTVLSCSLDFLRKKECDERGLLPYGYYGLVHTFIKIEGNCYDWGSWDAARQLSCTDPKIDCCYEESSISYSGSTQCANRIEEFEDAWENTGNKYSWWSWNCQRYTDAMKDFLENCYSDVKDAIP